MNFQITFVKIVKYLIAIRFIAFPYPAILGGGAALCGDGGAPVGGGGGRSHRTGGACNGKVDFLSGMGTRRMLEPKILRKRNHRGHTRYKLKLFDKEDITRLTRDDRLVPGWIGGAG